MKEMPSVFMVDDDQPILIALSRTLRPESYDVRCWTSAPAFLKDHDPDVPGCLICDLFMPIMGGLELRRELLRRGWYRPIIFLTGWACTQSAERSAQAGTSRFLLKPVMRSELLHVVHDAVREDKLARKLKSAHCAGYRWLVL
jgi:FixJ family two-component response regulator